MTEEIICFMTMINELYTLPQIKLLNYLKNKYKPGLWLALKYSTYRIISQMIIQFHIFNLIFLNSNHNLLIANKILNINLNLNHMSNLKQIYNHKKKMNYL